YNNLDSKNELDFHRFILYLDHEFSDDIRFYSELELEHSVAGEGKNGEIELEQAYLEFDLASGLRAKGGLFLVPVGFLNETHEPPVFYGVERNPVERNIIPTTWWEGGAALSGEFGTPGLSFDVALHSGLAIGPDFSIRGGRQKVSEANANNLAMSGRIKYTGIPGLELAGSIVYQDNITQELVIGAGSGRLVSTQVAWNRGPLSLRALFARWDLDGVLPEALRKDVQDGYYVEGAWKFNDKLGIFTRYNEWDNGGFGDTTISQIDLGLNYWPHRNVVVKFDLQNQAKAGDNDGFNLGIGYSF
ncbi:MAG: porin, partial [Gammaproteobacteria bacterium]